MLIRLLPEPPCTEMRTIEYLSLNDEPDAFVNILVCRFFKTDYQ